MNKLNPKFQKYFRPVAGVIIIVLGGVFMLFPFIPLGYIFVFAGLVLLVPYLPFMKGWIEYFKKKDNKNRVNNVEQKVEASEEKASNRFIKEPNGQTGKSEKGK